LSIISGRKRRKKQKLMQCKYAFSYKSTCFVCMYVFNFRSALLFFFFSLFGCSSRSNTYIPRRRFDVCPYWEEKKGERICSFKVITSYIYIYTYISWKIDRSALLYPRLQGRRTKEQRGKEKRRPSVSERRFCHNNARHVEFFLSRSMCSLIKDIT
jgi:hypothetical protein